MNSRQRRKARRIAEGFRDRYLAQVKREKEVKQEGTK